MVWAFIGALPRGAAPPPVVVRALTGWESVANTPLHSTAMHPARLRCSAEPRPAPRTHMPDRLHRHALRASAFSPLAPSPVPV